MIHIHILRVSNDSNFLEFRVECLPGYNFTTLLITRYDVQTKQDDVTLDCSHLLDGTTNEEVMQIPVTDLGTEVTMYYVEFGTTPVNPADPEDENVVGICSNVNFVYENLLDLVVNFNDCCISDADYETLDRNHMILYAHQEAMRLERYEDAIYFYNIIWNLFSHCPVKGRQANVINKPCNC